MQFSLKLQSELKLTATVMFCMDFVNKLTSNTRQQLGAVVVKYRRSLPNKVAIYLRGVESEKQIKPKNTVNRTLWRPTYKRLP